jgi:GNAT superfamily N-acetyltransferase
MRVEEAVVDDIEKIIDLGETFVKESPSLRMLNYSRVEFGKFCKHMIDDEINCMFLLKDEDDIHGVIAGGLHNRIGSLEKYLTEYIFYVHKAVRRDGGGKKLMDKFCDWAKSQSVKTVEMGVTADIDPKKADAYMKSLGFKYMGANFYKELE